MGLLKAFILAVSLALDVFAVSVGAGIRGGVDAGLRLRIGLAFASAEVLMNVIGAMLGAVAGRLLGGVAGYIGFVALVLLGSYMIVEALRERKQGEPLDMSRGWGLFVASLSISLDSLGIGFTILYIGVPVAITLAVIAIVSVVSTFSGLALGKALGRRVEEGAELWSGILLVATGLFFIAQKYFGFG
ncbi:MAG: manganese efflux pump [Candidatus Eremiobacteraeota bacterium]|nr:manganese efflux pump [Candidatus Eremiobacteraeota bacterium]